MSTKRFYVFTDEHCGLPLACRLKDEGYNTTLVLIEPNMSAASWKAPHGLEEIAKHKKAMQYKRTNGQGLVRIIWAAAAMPEILRARKEDTYVIFDQIYGWKYGEQLRKRGFKVLGGTRLGYDLEMERDKTLSLLKGLGFDIPLQQKFGKGSSAKGIEFLRSQKSLFVLKSDNPKVVTLAADESNDELIKKLEVEKKEIDREDFILQQKVQGIEANCETWYSCGVPVMCNVDIEAKKKYNEMCEIQVGCSFDNVWTVPLDSPIRKLCNAPFDKWVASRIKTGRLDLSVIYEPQTRKAYALEVCGDRNGYNQIYTLLSLLKVPAGEFFSDFLDGKYTSDIGEKLFEGFGGSLRVFNDGEKADQEITFNEKDKSNTWLWDVHADKDGRLFTTGDDSVGILTAQGENPESAMAKIRDLFHQFHMATKWARDSFDDDDDVNLPLSRYHALKRLKLI